MFVLSDVSDFEKSVYLSCRISTFIKRHGFCPIVSLRLCKNNIFIVADHSVDEKTLWRSLLMPPKVKTLRDWQIGGVDWLCHFNIHQIGGVDFHLHFNIGKSEGSIMGALLWPLKSEGSIVTVFLTFCNRRGQLCSFCCNHSNRRGRLPSHFNIGKIGGVNHLCFFRWKVVK